MTDATAIADRYIAAWNETDPAARRARIAALWTEDAEYRDPLMRGCGHAEIDGLIAAVHAQCPGHQFALAGVPDAYAGRLRFSWTLRADGAEPIARGTDFAVLAEDGRLAIVTGFLDQAPA